MAGETEERYRMGFHDDAVEFLRSIDLFSQLREYELDVIARHSEAVTFRRREVIFTKDEPSDVMYIVARGRVGIFSVDDNNEAVIAQLIGGESLGELDFLGKVPRSATAIADEDCELIRFPAGGFSAEEIFQDNPYISAHMLYRMLGIVSDRIWTVRKQVTEKSGWVSDLRRQLMCDKQTGLYNRIYLKEDLCATLPDRCSSAAFLMIKPDNFKEINDVYGHKAGDQALNLLAIFLQSALGEDDIAIRYHGDEFAAFIPEAGRELAIQRAKDINRAFRSIDLSGVTGGAGLRISVSIGITMYPDEIEDGMSLVDIAYKKMFKARLAGGSRISI